MYIHIDSGLNASTVCFSSLSRDLFIWHSYIYWIFRLRSRSRLLYAGYLGELGLIDNSKAGEFNGNGEWNENLRFHAEDC